MSTLGSEMPNPDQENLELLCLRTISLGNALIDAVSKDPGVPMGSYYAGVFVPGQAVAIGNNDPGNAQSVLLEKSDGGLTMHAYERRAVNDVDADERVTKTESTVTADASRQVTTTKLIQKSRVENDSNCTYRVIEEEIVLGSLKDIAFNLAHLADQRGQPRPRRRGVA